MEKLQRAPLSCIWILLPFLVVCFIAAPAQLRAADTLPAQLTDAEFWRLVTNLSEPDAFFPYENFVSNERQYQVVIADMVKTAPANGVYLGVAAEQNFSYVAALKPRMAFIVDIRRQNMIELLLYKALFEMSKDRAEFVSRLFSRKCPATVNERSTAKQLFDACGSSAVDNAYFETTLQAVRERLVQQHQFRLTTDDERKIKLILDVFRTGGSRIDYTYASVHPAGSAYNNPNYYDLMTAPDIRGTNWSYLDKEEAYQRVRTMQLKNLIVPVVGDFGGPQALKAVGRYLKDHDAKVSVFYISNVEDYLQPKWSDYRANIAALPTDPSSFFIRVYIGASRTFIAPMNALPAAYPGRSY